MRKQPLPQPSPWRLLSLAIGGLLSLVALPQLAPAAVPPLPDPPEPGRTHLSAGGFGAALIGRMDGSTPVAGAVVPIVGRADEGFGVLRSSRLGFFSTLDRRAPSASILSPAQCDNFTDPSDIAFLVSAADAAGEAGSGVHGVEVALQDNDDARYWNGTTWVEDEHWHALVPAASPGTFELPTAAIQAWPIWSPERAFRLSARATDESGNRGVALPSGSVLFQFDSDRPVTQIDFPVASSLYSAGGGRPVDVVEGRSCEEASTPITDVKVRLRVVATTVDPSADDRFGLYLDELDEWVPEPTWLSVDLLSPPDWSLGTLTDSFECGPSAPAGCGHGVQVTSAALTAPGDPDEDDGASILFFYDVEAPVSRQVSPPDRSKQSAVAVLEGLAKDCGNAGDPLDDDVDVELQVVRQIWNATSSSFEDGTLSWNGSTWTSSSATNWVPAVDEQLVPFEACPAEGWSYSWTRSDPALASWFESDGHGLRFRVRTRSTDGAGNRSWSLGDTFHFDNVAPNPPSAHPDILAPVSAFAPGGGPAIGHDDWQNLSPEPVFSWAEPWDDCNPALASCDLSDPDRESSGIARYLLSWSDSDLPTTPPEVELSPADREYESARFADEGIFTFRVWAEDEAGNRSASSDFVVKHDVTPPLVSTVAEPPLNSRLYITSVPRIAGTATDPISGGVASDVAGVEVRLHRRAVDLSTGLPTGPITFWDGNSWVGTETWVATTLTDLGGSGWEWALDMPQDPPAWDFEHQYTVRARAIDHAENVTPQTEWGLGRFRISRPVVLNPLMVRPRRVPWNASYSPGFRIGNPLTEAIDVGFTFRENIVKAENPQGIDYDPSSYADYSLGTNPDRTFVIHLEPGETQWVGVGRSHYWRWLGPVEDDFLECAGTGMLSLLPGPSLSKLAKLKQLKKVKKGIDRVNNVGGVASVLYSLADLLLPAFVSMPNVEFQHVVDSASPAVGVDPVSVRNLDLVDRRIAVEVPRSKMRELTVSSSLSIGAEVTSIAADGDPEPISKAALYAVEAGEVLAACEYSRSAADPDPNFDVLAPPSYVQVEDVTTDPVLRNEPAAREVLQTILDLHSNRQAMFAARNKIWGAANAGDEDWVVNQSEAMRFYAGLAREAQRELADHFERILDERASGGLTLSDAQIASVKQAFAADGLPPVEEEILSDFGFSQAVMDAHAGAFAIDPVDPAELADWYELMREELAAMPESLRDFADTETSEYVLLLEDFDEGTFDGWTVLGDWGLLPLGDGSEPEHVAAGGSGSGPGLLLSETSFAGSHRIAVDVQFGEQPISLLWHVQDENNYGELRVSPGTPATVEAFLVEAGVPRSLIGPVSATLPDRPWHELQVELIEDAISIYVDDEPDPDFPDALIPRLIGEAVDSTFTSGGVGLATAGSDDLDSLFDLVSVRTVRDGRRDDRPVLTVTPSPATPTDTELVTFEVDAPADAVEVSLFVGGQLVQSWTGGGLHEWTGGPFDAGCTVHYAATAAMPDGTLAIPQVAENEALIVTDTTPPAVVPTSATLELEAQDCDGVNGWVDWVPWLNVQVHDACDETPERTPESGVEQRYYLGSTDIPLGVTDESGNEGQAQFELLVVNTPPELPVPAAGTSDEGASLVLSATATDPRTKSLVFRWDFGDGTPVVEHLHDGLDPTEPVTVEDFVDHVYGDDGVYTVTVSVEDDCGTVTSQVTTVEVANLPPALGPIGPFAASEGTPATLQVDATDPGSDDLSFEWSFDEASLAALTGLHYNDGSGPDGPLSGPGTHPFDATDVQEILFGDDAEIAVTVLVSDDDGGTATASGLLTVSNLPPVIVPFGPFDVDEADVLDLLAQAVDPGSDDLSFEWSFGHPSLPSSEGFHFNDGLGPDPPESGPGTFPFEPFDAASVVYGDDSVYTLELVVSDDDGGVASWSTEVSVANLPPQIDEGSVVARSAAEIRLRLVGPPGLETRWHPAPGPPVTQYVPGFAAELHVFSDGDLLASASTVEADSSGTAALSLGVLELPLGAETSVRVRHSTRLDRATAAIVELVFADSLTRTAAHVFPPPLAAPGHVQQPVPFEEPIERDWRTALGQLMAGDGSEAGDLRLQATVRGLQEQLDEGLLELSLEEDGLLLDSESLDIEEHLRAIRRSGFPDLDGDRLPDDYLLELEPLSLDPAATQEARFRHATGRESLPAGLARVGAAGSAAGLDLAWPAVEAELRCDRPVRDFDCLSFEWSAALGALLSGTTVQVEARGSDPGTDDLEFSWDWGDGSADDVATYFNDGAGPDPRPSPEGSALAATDSQEHLYAGSGDFPVTLRLSDDDGGTVEQELVVLLLAGNRAPVIDLASLVTGEVLEDPHGAGHRHLRNFVFVEVGLSDSDSDELTALLDWGDGSVESIVLSHEGDPADGSPFAPQLEAKHDYDEGGVYEVRLVVSDDAGAETEHEFSIITTGN